MRIIRFLAYAWIIIVGGLMITPDGVQCIACGRTLTTVLAVLSIGLGVVGLIGEFRSPNVRV